MPHFLTKAVTLLSISINADLNDHNPIKPTTIPSPSLPSHKSTYQKNLDVIVIRSDDKNPSPPEFPPESCPLASSSTTPLFNAVYTFRVIHASIWLSFNERSNCRACFRQYFAALSAGKRDESGAVLQGYWKLSIERVSEWAG